MIDSYKIVVMIASLMKNNRKMIYLYLIHSLSTFSKSMTLINRKAVVYRIVHKNEHAQHKKFYDVKIQKK